MGRKPIIVNMANVVNPFNKNFIYFIIITIIIIIIIIIIILIIIVIIDFVLKPQWFLFHVTPNI